MSETVHPAVVFSVSIGHDVFALERPKRTYRYPSSKECPASSPPPSLYPLLGPLPVRYDGAFGIICHFPDYAVYRLDSFLQFFRCFSQTGSYDPPNGVRKLSRPPCDLCHPLGDILLCNIFCFDCRPPHCPGNGLKPQICVIRPATWEQSWSLLKCGERDGRVNLTNNHKKRAPNNRSERKAASSLHFPQDHIRLSITRLPRACPPHIHR